MSTGISRLICLDIEFSPSTGRFSRLADGILFWYTLYRHWNHDCSSFELHKSQDFENPTDPFSELISKGGKRTCIWEESCNLERRLGCARGSIPAKGSWHLTGNTGSSLAPDNNGSSITTNIPRRGRVLRHLITRFQMCANAPPIQEESTSTSRQPNLPSQARDSFPSAVSGTWSRGH